MNDPAGFDGFGGGAIDFFAELAENQSRDWFVANRARFDEAIGVPMAQLVTSVSLALAGRDIPLQGTPKTSIFRMNRDIRFSKDKSPYKTHIGAVLTRSGAKQRSGGVLYIHVGLDGMFLAAGFYDPEPAELGALRRAIMASQAEWRAVTRELAAHKLAVGMDSMMARLPQGFDAGSIGKVGDWVRLKSFAVKRDLAPAEITDAGLVTIVADFASAAQPLLRFGWRALEVR